MQSLAGAGDTIPPMVFSVITAWLIQLPLAYFLPQVGDLGVKGVRWGLVAGVIFQGLAAAAYFQLGRWKGKQV
jgi:Na+-driven multidrug efflux pump